MLKPEVCQSMSGDFKIESFIRLMHAVNPGNSGGALVNNQGGACGYKYGYCLTKQELLQDMPLQ